MRVFFAVNLSLELQQELARLQSQLRSKIHGVRWVAPHLLHITLKFIGEIDASLLPLFKKPLQVLGQNTTAFVVSLGRLGAFPSLNNPRVFWIGLEEGTQQLGALATDLEQCLRLIKPLQARVPVLKNNSKKPFQPHITIGRKKKIGETDKIDLATFEKAETCGNLLPVKSFYLMQSRLYPTGPLYTPLEEFLFKA